MVGFPPLILVLRSTSTFFFLRSVLRRFEKASLGTKVEKEKQRIHELGRIPAEPEPAERKNWFMIEGNQWVVRGPIGQRDRP